MIGAPGKTVLFSLLLALAFVQTVWSQDVSLENSVQPTSVSSLLDFTIIDFSKDPMWLQSDPVSSQLEFSSRPWSAFYRTFEKNDHELTFSGGLSSAKEPFIYGESLEAGKFASGFTYRYKGLFKGIVRPVARMTLGAGQNYGALPGGVFTGYAPGAYSYAVSEMGVEIVYKGVGVGVTAAHMWVLQDQFIMQDDKFTGGPFFPETGKDAFKDFFTNVYLILE